MSDPGGASRGRLVTHHMHSTRSVPEDRARALPEAPRRRGFERVYEINRNFRNEGLSTRHNPSSRCSSSTRPTPLRRHHEPARAAAAGLADSVLGTRALVSRASRSTSRRRSAARRSRSCCSSTTPAQARLAARGRYLRALLTARGHKWAAGDGAGKLQMQLFDTASSRTSCSRPSPMPTDRGLAAVALQRCGPVHHRSLRILRRRARARQRFSELNDPEEQAARFRAQVRRKEAGDEEGHVLRCRLLARSRSACRRPAARRRRRPAGDALRRCASIRDVLLFPQLKPKAERRLTRPGRERQRREAGAARGREGWPRARD